MPEASLDQEMLHYQRIIQEGKRALGEAFYSIKVPTPPAYARSIAASHQRIRAMDEEFGLLSSSEVGQLMGSRSESPRNSALAARRAGRLLALQEGSQLMFPGFQFDENHAPRRVIRKLRELASACGWSERSAVMWLIAPTTYLDGQRPVDILDTAPETVLEVAEQSWTAAW